METSVPAETPVQRYGFQFRGNAVEYFGIWIVNILLTILTLGIYSAWAKVRRQRYFYGNTVLDDHVFEYHARPVQILIGRIIAVAVLVLISIITSFFPLSEILLFPVYIFGVPWVIQRALRFNARVSSYRNIRFDFVGSYWGAMKAYVLGYLVAVLTFGFAAPVATRWTAHYLVDNFRFGGRPFFLGRHADTPGPSDEPFPQDDQLPLGDLYRAFFISFGVAILAVVIIVVPAVIGVFAVQESLSETGFVVLLQAAIFLLVFALLIGGLVYGALTRNVIFCAATLEHKHALGSFVSAPRFVWITLSNVLATLLTLGLMRPWAAVRMARYMTSVTAVASHDGFDAYAAALLDERGVASAELADIEGFDIGIGF